MSLVKFPCLNWSMSHQYQAQSFCNPSVFPPHAAGQGECSFAEYAAYIMETAGLPAEIVPVSSEWYEQSMLNRLQDSKENDVFPLQAAAS